MQSNFNICKDNLTPILGLVGLSYILLSIDGDKQNLHSFLLLNIARLLSILIIKTQIYTQNIKTKIFFITSRMNKILCSLAPPHHLWLLSVFKAPNFLAPNSSTIHKPCGFF